MSRWKKIEPDQKTEGRNRKSEIQKAPQIKTTIKKKKKKSQKPPKTKQKPPKRIQKPPILIQKPPKKRAAILIHYSS